MATLTNNDIAKAIYLSVKGKDSGATSAVLKSATSMLAKKRLLGRSKRILNSLEKIINEDMNRLEILAESASPLREEDKKYIKEILKKKYGDKEFIFKESTNTELIGGVRLRIRDEVIDLTLKNKINKLKAYLIKKNE